MSKYKGVKYVKQSSVGSKSWQSYYKGHRALHETEKAAAKSYDLMLIKDNKEPVNVLTRVKE